METDDSKKDSVVENISSISQSLMHTLDSELKIDSEQQLHPIIRDWINEDDFLSILVHKSVKDSLKALQDMHEVVTLCCQSNGACSYDADSSMWLFLAMSAMNSLSTEKVWH